MTRTLSRLGLVTLLLATALPATSCKKVEDGAPTSAPQATHRDGRR